MEPRADMTMKVSLADCDPGRYRHYREEVDDWIGLVDTVDGIRRRFLEIDEDMSDTEVSIKSANYFLENYRIWDRHGDPHPQWYLLWRDRRQRMTEEGQAALIASILFEFIRRGVEE